MSKIHLSELKRKQFLVETVDFILSGTRKKDIAEYFTNVYQLEENQIDELILAAYKTLSIDNIDDVMAMIDQHTNLYEYIYKKFFDMGFTAGMLKSLRFKEKLLGLHKENTNIVINNQFNLEVNIDEYNIEKLNSQEQSRLQLLLEKTTKYVEPGS